VLILSDVQYSYPSFDANMGYWVSFCLLGRGRYSFASGMEIRNEMLNFLLEPGFAMFWFAFDFRFVSACEAVKCLTTVLKCV